MNEGAERTTANEQKNSCQERMSALSCILPSPKDMVRAGNEPEAKKQERKEYNRQKNGCDLHFNVHIPDKHCTHILRLLHSNSRLDSCHRNLVACPLVGAKQTTENSGYGRDTSQQDQSPDQHFGDSFQIHTMSPKWLSTPNPRPQGGQALPGFAAEKEP